MARFAYLEYEQCKAKLVHVVLLLYLAVDAETAQWLLSQQAAF